MRSFSADASLSAFPRIAATLVCSAMGFSDPAQAALLRGAGGSVSQDTFIEIYGIAPTANFVPGANLLRSFTGAMEMSVSSRQPFVFATPRDECFGSIQFTEPPIPEGGGEPDLTGWQPDELHTACTYVFARGGAIHLEGSFENHLAGSIIDLVWSISGHGRVLTWGMDDVTLDWTGTRSATVYLDALLPSDMPLGDYAISLAFTQTAGSGLTMYRRSDASYGGVQGGCADQRDATTCGTEVRPLASWSLSGPRLRDTASFRVVEAVAEVPLPPTAGLFGLGMAALWLSRRRQRL